MHAIDGLFLHGEIPVDDDDDDDDDDRCTDESFIPIPTDITHLAKPHAIPVPPTYLPTYLRTTRGPS